MIALKRQLPCGFEIVDLVDDVNSTLVEIAQGNWQTIGQRRSRDLDRSVRFCGIRWLNLRVSNYEGLTVVASFRNERKALTRVSRQLVLVWPTSLDPSWFLAYLMTSFLCETRNEGWSKHVAMLSSGSLRNAGSCLCQVCCRN